MSPTIDFKSSDTCDFQSYSAVNLLQPKGQLKPASLPIPVSKAAFKALMDPNAVKDPVLKDFALEIIELVHGSELNKAEIAKKVQQKFPKLKLADIKQFISDYFKRTACTQEDV